MKNNRKNRKLTEIRKRNSIRLGFSYFVGQTLNEVSKDLGLTRDILRDKSSLIER